MEKVNVLKFKEHDLEINGDESTIREFVTTIRELQKSAGSDLPNTLNDILFQMEIVLNIDGLGKENGEESQELLELLTIDTEVDIII